MKLVIAAIGRMKRGAEQDLCARYTKRIDKAGRGLGLGPLRIVEFNESRAPRPAERKAQEAELLLNAAPPEAAKFVLDEHGSGHSSRSFTDLLSARRDDGVAEAWFFIGGADGHGDALLTAATDKIALGQMTWPHQIVRCLLAEQIYRAITILSGHPYHRD
uniref:23S rRNA (pseudouridine(1915)-N(3))-methyltransferase RlmH n=1 Tax=Pararhizobium sp. IMCC3301 TaxID=3067904 RepID=UPI0027424900|nr:23S rRNA (pseudouridine(1915)-N(3))-methyltransferase RlmH [Pararhizobium sp. IMCC3301]